MVIIRDEQRIHRLKQTGRYASMLGMALLLGGLIVGFTTIPGALTIQLFAVLGGWLISQVGGYLAHRYVYSPRPDQVLDDALKKVARNGRLYHYQFPAPHVLLLPSGIVVLVSKFQTGKIFADGDRWKQKGLGLRKFFGQEGLGNPTRDAETMVASVASYLHKHAPAIKDMEVPIGAIIVFTAKGLKTLDVSKSRIPAMHFTKLKGFMRQQRKEEKPMPTEVYEAIREAFDTKAAHLLEYENGDSA